MSQEFLNEEGQEQVEKFILYERLDLARIFIAGALYEITTHKRINKEDVEDAYRKLGLSTEELMRFENQKLQ